MGGSLDRSAFSARSFKTEKVEFPGRDGSVTVREMTAGDALAFFTEVSNAEKRDVAAVPPALWLAHRCIVTDGGERLFNSPEDAGDCLTREELSAINTVIMRVNGMDGETEKKPSAP